jgi:hypothetical protein
MKEDNQEKISLLYKVHTPNLLKEILNNKECAILNKPLMIFRDILEQVATRASQLNDIELNKLMMRLALYEVSDPESKEYDSEFVNNYIDGTYTEKEDV